jgi:hypothetical protein
MLYLFILQNQLLIDSPKETYCEKLIVAELVKKFLDFVELCSCYLCHKNSPLDPVLAQTNLDDILTP